MPNELNTKGHNKWASLLFSWKVYRALWVYRMPIYSFSQPPYKAFSALWVIDLVYDGHLVYWFPVELLSMFPDFCACCCIFFIRLTNDARCVLSLQNAFVQLSLAFRNDNYTLDTRLKQAERERNLMEENTEKELVEFKNSLKVSLVRGEKLAPYSS